MKLDRSFLVPTHRAARAALGLAAALAASGALAVIAEGCGSDTGAADATSGARVTLHTRVAIEPASLAEFTTGFGWKVTLAKAAASLGALYYFDGAPAFVQRDAPRAPARDALGRLFGLAVAHAHPGHYLAGDALGQMLAPTSLDVFGGAQTLPDASGVTGDYRSARFVFGDHPVGPAAAVLGGHVAVAEGTAVKADGSTKTPIHFTVSADFADVAKSVVNGEVEGCDFTEAHVDADGTVTLTLRPAIWFELVDFATVAPGTAASPTVIPHGHIAQIGFALGLVQLTAYRFAYAK
jgi:hypothetical protein